MGGLLKVRRHVALRRIDSPREELVERFLYIIGGRADFPASRATFNRFSISNEQSSFVIDAKLPVAPFGLDDLGPVAALSALDRSFEAPQSH
jgi:hypothetical protein